MARLLSLPAITAAITTAVTPVYQVKGGAPHDLTLQAAFTWGSGGTSVDCWVQTSIDGSNFFDVANFHFGGASARYIFNLSSNTPVTSEYTPTDGTLTANTCVDGLLGHLFRCKYSSSGIYAGGTSLAIDALSSSRLEPMCEFAARPRGWLRPASRRVAFYPCAILPGAGGFLRAACAGVNCGAGRITPCRGDGRVRPARRPAGGVADPATTPAAGARVKSVFGLTPPT